MTTTETERRSATQHCRCGNSWRVQVTPEHKVQYLSQDDDNQSVDCSGLHGPLATIFDDQPVTDQQLAEHWAATEIDAAAYDARFEQPTAQQVSAENLSDPSVSVDSHHSTEGDIMTTTTIEHAEALRHAADIAGSVDLQQLNALAILLGEDPVSLSVQLIERIDQHRTPGVHLEYCPTCSAGSMAQA